MERLNEIGINASSLGKLIRPYVDIVLIIYTDFTELRSLLVLMHCDVTQATVDRIKDCKVDIIIG